MKAAKILAAAVFLIVPTHALRAQAAGSTAINDRLAELANPMRVLTVAAHPDDEDTGLITWLARGQHVNTAYLSLTRGDGGQNLIGNELGEALGVIRTEELLAARRIDGAHQYFTRAYDFGFSKSADETFSHWPKDSLLGDVVKVVRAFRPQVMIAFFSGTPVDGHGQHQVSAILAREAYESAAEDTVRFPVAKFGAPWRVSKFYRTGRQEPRNATLTINVGEYNPVLGESYAELAAESRSQHKSQGFGTLKRKGVVKSYLIRVDSRVPAPADAKMEKSIFDGLEGTIAAEKARLADDQSWERPPLPPNGDIAFEAIADREAVAIGDSVKVTMTIYNRSTAPIGVGEDSGCGPLAAHTVCTSQSPRLETLLPDSVHRWVRWIHPIADASGSGFGAGISQPWWLATPRNGDLFSPPIPGIPEDELDKNHWVFALIKRPSEEWPREIGAPVVFHFADPVRGDVQRPVIVAPGVSVTLDRTVEIARANSPIDRFVNVTLHSALSDTMPVSVRLNLPNGLTADSASRTRTMGLGGTTRVTFRVRGVLPKGSYTIGALATAKGITYASGYVPIEYEHITPRTMYRPARIALDAIDFALPKNLSVAYVPGVGDNVAPMLEEMGVPIAVIEPEQIPTVDLSRFTTIVVGPRAYQASQDLIDNNAYLLDYVKKGGRLVVQYGQYELMRPGVMPYPITIRNPHDRVTDENAPVTILDPAAPVLNTPNRITQQDFAGWIQERALYMPYTMDAHYHAVMAMNDPGEEPNNGAIISTTYGRGTYFYVPLALFRQLPAGVSGGARIFANLLAGK